MPAQKRPHDASSHDDDDDHNSPHPDHTDHDDNDHDLSEQRQPPEDNNEDSDGSVSSAAGDIDENRDRDQFVTVKLAEIRKEVQCPICLGIIRKTRTVMECLHRFCRECIDKSMRLGNNECPACRTHCASRRSLRDDPNYDALIAVLYPDIDKYEAEELAFHEEEKARNKQIQASIAQTLRRQSEALGRKRTTARATAAAFVRRQGTHRNLRGRRNQRASEFQGSDNEDDNGHDEGKDSSSTDEPSTEVKPKRYKRWGGARFSQCSLAASSAEGGGNENEPEVTRDMVGAAAGLVGSSEMFGWGRGGMRSNTRHGSLSGGSGKSARNSRLSKLIDHLKHLQENEEVDIHLNLVSLDDKTIPNLEQSYICCSPSMSVKHLCQLVAIETAVEADEVEILLVKDVGEEAGDKRISTEKVPFTPVNPELVTVDPLKDELHVLKDHDTLTSIQGLSDSSQHGLLLAYRKKLSDSANS